MYLTENHFVILKKNPLESSLLNHQSANALQSNIIYLKLETIQIPFFCYINHNLIKIRLIRLILNNIEMKFCIN